MPFFKVRDLMINVVDERLKLKGGAALCLEDQPTQLECGRASPIMHAIKLVPVLERTVTLTQAVVKSGDPEGVPAIREIAADIGLELVGGALAGGGVGMPNPDCGGTSLETIPPTLTPVVHKGSILTAADLPSIKHRIREALTAVEKLESQLAPRGGVETEVAYDHLRGAADSLRSK